MLQAFARSLSRPFSFLRAAAVAVALLAVAVTADRAAAADAIRVAVLKFGTVNWLMDVPLGGRLRGRTLDLVEGHGCREYFDPLTGAGLGADDFSWTAAIALDWSCG